LLKKFDLITPRNTHCLCFSSSGRFPRASLSAS
jgi:hypothetical protein